MRKMITTIALIAGVMSMSASADQATLDALQANGVSLTETQANEVAAISCDAGSTCTELVDKVAELVAANSEDDAAVINVLAAAAKAHPVLAAQFGDAAMIAAPGAIATIAAAMINIAPTAAGPGRAGARGLQDNPGLAVRELAIPAFARAIPAPPGGGGSSSPN
ncbi:MAG: hypothetical protein ISEC1_P0792 [Thiomicrorhabdus sp.]|nr:MAG: hypothetical protein ISEC1_P0792 [Thiomicrorhabdus sp.]